MTEHYTPTSLREFARRAAGHPIDLGFSEVIDVHADAWDAALDALAALQKRSIEVEDAIHAWTAPYPYADKGYCYLCGEIDGHKDVDWPLGVHENGETEHAILPCPIELLEIKP